MQLDRTHFSVNGKTYTSLSPKLCCALLLVSTLLNSSLFAKFSLPKFREVVSIPYLQVTEPESMRFKAPEITAYFVGKPLTEADRLRLEKQNAKTPGSEAPSLSVSLIHKSGKSNSAQAQETQDKGSSSTQVYSTPSTPRVANDSLHAVSTTSVSSTASVGGAQEPDYAPILLDDCAPKASAEDLIPFFQYPSAPTGTIEISAGVSPQNGSIAVPPSSATYKLQ